MIICIVYLYIMLYTFVFFFLMIRRPPKSNLLPYTTLFRSTMEKKRKKKKRKGKKKRKKTKKKKRKQKKERSEEHTSELQQRGHLVSRLLLEQTTALQNTTIKITQRAKKKISSCARIPTLTT